MFRYFLYASLAFLAYALVEADYLVLPRVRSPAALAGAFALLIAGFLVEAASWHRLLRLHGVPVRFAHSLASAGLSIFGKYVPGKLWVIVGRSAFLAERGVGSMSALTVASVQAQALAILTGLLLGAPVLLQVPRARQWSLLALAGAAGIAFMLLHPGVNRLASSLLARLTGRDAPRLPLLTAAGLVRVMPWYLAMWLCWSGAFHLLAQALTAAPLPASLGLAFALAGTLGILAIVTPGGLGVREGVLAACLIGLGLSTVDATSVAVFSRLWFLAGETFVFTAGGLAARRLAPASRGG